MSANDATPAVSVVVPLYNKAAYVQLAVESVLAQSFGDLELIVVDDGSTDAGGEIVANMQDARVHLIRQANAGVAAARNTGIRAARGRWVAFLDADDTWRLDKLARQLAALGRAPDVVWAAGAFATTARDRTRRPPDTPDAWFAAADVLKDGLLILGAGWMLWTGTVMVRRDVLAQLGGFDPILKVGEDVYLWVRLAVQHPRLIYVRTPIAEYRVGVERSLIRQAVEHGNPDQAELARRMIAMTASLPENRSVLLRRHARNMILRQAKAHLLFGRWRDLKATLAIGESLDLGSSGKWLKMATCLPSGPIAPGIEWATRLRRRIRRATERP
jgi:glycosyltransferase involved in cell wall biosynthesis